MESLWSATAKLPRFPQLEGTKKTDVLIIGGGIAGLLTAYFLQQSGVDYLLVEQGRICGGTTKNTTAKITAQHGLIYHKLVKDKGLDAARVYLRANESALNMYTALCERLSCDYEVRDNYVYATESPTKLAEEMEALQKIGYAAELCETLQLPIPTVGAVKFSNQAQFHPLKFLAAIAKGLNICENTFVRALEGNTAVTAQGKIHASCVIVATHFPFLNKHGAYYLKLYQHRSYVLAFRTRRNWTECMLTRREPAFPFGTMATSCCSAAGRTAQASREGTGKRCALLQKRTILPQKKNTFGRRRTA